MKKFSTLIAFLLIWMKLTAQSPLYPSDSLISYHPLKTYSLNLMQCMVRELRLTYEQSLNNSFSLAYNMGYRFSKSNANPKVQAGAGSTYLTFPTFNNKHYNGIYLSVMPRYRLVRRGNKFLGVEFYDQFLWFNNKYVIYDNVESENENFNALRTERVNTTGINILLELQIIGIAQLSKKVKMYPSLFGDAGIFYRQYQFESSNGTWREEPIIGIKKEKGHYWFPTFHLGVKLSFSKE